MSPHPAQLPPIKSGVADRPSPSRGEWRDCRGLRPPIGIAARAAAEGDWSLHPGESPFHESGYYIKSRTSREIRRRAAEPAAAGRPVSTSIPVNISQSRPRCGCLAVKFVNTRARSVSTQAHKSLAFLWVLRLTDPLRATGRSQFVAHRGGQFPRAQDVVDDALRVYFEDTDFSGAPRPSPRQLCAPLLLRLAPTSRIPPIWRGGLSTGPAVEEKGLTAQHGCRFSPAVSHYSECESSGSAPMARSG